MFSWRVSIQALFSLLASSREGFQDQLVFCADSPFPVSRNRINSIDGYPHIYDNSVLGDY